MKEKDDADYIRSNSDGDLVNCRHKLSQNSRRSETDPVITVTMIERTSISNDPYSVDSDKCSLKDSDSCSFKGSDMCSLKDSEVFTLKPSERCHIKDSNGNCFDYEQDDQQESQLTVPSDFEKPSTTSAASHSQVGSVLELPKMPSKELSDESLKIPKDTTRTRKISWGSVESDTGSRASLTTMSASFHAKIRRSTSLRTPRPLPNTDTVSSISVPTNEFEGVRVARRTVSLHIPREACTTYSYFERSSINEEILRALQKSQPRLNQRRKSSIRQALSLLNLNTVSRRESFISKEKKEKPVQKILRQPTRRHNTVRGMSGLAIDGSHQRYMGMGGLHRSQTVYYPTTTSVRQSYAAYGRRSTYT